VRHLTYKVRFLGLVALAIAGMWPLAAQAATAPGLGSAGNFAVLSAAPGHGGAVTCTDGTIIGDVGSSGLRASVVQTSCPITGSIIAPVSAKVVADFNKALATGLGAACTTTPLASTLSGTTTLASGTYCTPAGLTVTNGTIILTGSGPWNFEIGTGGTGALTGTSLTVTVLTGNPCNVFWFVAQAATMTDSTFVGTILAGAAISLTRGTFHGNALAGAAVTITGTTVTGCAGGKDTGKDKADCNQGVGNGPEGCDPGNSNNHNTSNDENGGVQGDPGRQGSK
jgi:Ice-binding-like